MQRGFISCPGNVRMPVLQDGLKLLPQAILCLLEAISSQTSLSATNKESSAYSLFLWPPCVLQRGECSPPPRFSCLLGATFELQRSSGTFCDPGSRSQAADGRLEEEQPLKVEVNGFRRSKPLCTSQLSSLALFQ